MNSFGCFWRSEIRSADTRCLWVGALSSSVDIYFLFTAYTNFPLPTFVQFLFFRSEKNMIPRQKQRWKKKLIRFYSVIALHRIVLAYLEHEPSGLTERYLQQFCTNRTFDRTQFVRVAVCLHHSAAPYFSAIRNPAHPFHVHNEISFPESSFCFRQTTNSCGRMRCIIKKLLLK